MLAEFVCPHAGGYADMDGRRGDPVRFLTGYRSWAQMLVRLVAAAILLFLLDLLWIKGLAPLLGLDYFGVVEVRRDVAVGPSHTK